MSRTLSLLIYLGILSIYRRNLGAWGTPPTSQTAHSDVLLASDWGCGMGWSRDMGRVGWLRAADDWGKGGMEKIRDAGRD